MPNYNFAINSTYDPFTFQELLTPYVMYKEAFDKAETAYGELADKADRYKYLGQQLEGQDSEAARIYKGYAQELDKQAKDFAKHGLNMGNRRGLTNLRRRYAGEIGRLDLANTALEEERKLRRTMNAKDGSILYATDNLRIDDFLDNGSPNLYNVSGTELYTRGAAAGKAASSRVFSKYNVSNISKYYQDYARSVGYDPQKLAEFRQNLASIPELQQTANSILQERGVLDNLTGNNRTRAQQSVINGIIDGAIYNEQHDLQRNLGVMTAAEADQSARGWAADRRAEEEHKVKMEGYRRALAEPTKDDQGNVTVYAGTGKSAKQKTFNADEVALITKVNGDLKKSSYRDNKDGSRTIIIRDANNRQIGETVTINTDGSTYLGNKPAGSKSRFGKGFNNKGKMFNRFEYNSWNDNSEEVSEGADFGLISTPSRVITDVPKSNLSSTQKAKILENLKPYNLTLNDVIVEVDDGMFSNNEYRVKIKPEVRDEIINASSGTSSTPSTSSTSSTSSTKVGRGEI